MSNESSPITDVNHTLNWFIDSSEIVPGHSAIIGNNKLAFFIIHHVAICIITISLVASLIVIGQIHSKWRRASSKLDFPVRFPLYLAIADFGWGVSHLIDHMYLVTTQVYPTSNFLKEGLSMNLWFFFGYQQLMHASVAGYTYIRVVRRKQLNLGHWEWKLHLVWFSFLSATLVLFHYMDAFGSSGYWMAYNPSNVGGLILLLVIALTSTFNSCCTTLGYYRLRKTLLQMRSRLNGHNSPLSKTDVSKSSQVQKTVASQCLTTYVYVAACLYCPLAILFWVSIIFRVTMGVLEPLTCFLVIVVANSSGWANAYGYCWNEKLKRKEKEVKLLKMTSDSHRSSSH